MRFPALALASRRAAWGAFALLLVAWFIGTHTPPGNLPKTPGGDKIKHYLGYVTITLALGLARSVSRFPKQALVIFAVALLIGGLDEVTQPPFGRTMDVYDWLADAGGAATAIVLLLALGKIARPKFTPLAQ